MQSPSQMHQIQETHEKSSSNHTRMSSVVDLEMMDVGTQVYAIPRDPVRAQRIRNRQLRLPLIMTNEICDFEGCNHKAHGGKCEFSICFVKGCQKNLCLNHAAKSMNPKEDSMAGKVCVECETRANRAFYLAIGLFFLVAFLIALPGIIIYGGDTSSVPPSVGGDGLI